MHRNIRNAELAVRFWINSEYRFLRADVLHLLARAPGEIYEARGFSGSRLAGWLGQAGN